VAPDDDGVVLFPPFAVDWELLRQDDVKSLLYGANAVSGKRTARCWPGLLEVKTNRLRALEMVEGLSEPVHREHGRVDWTITTSKLCEILEDSSMQRLYMLAMFAQRTVPAWSNNWTMQDISWHLFTIPAEAEAQAGHRDGSGDVAKPMLTMSVPLTVAPTGGFTEFYYERGREAAVADHATRRPQLETFSFHDIPAGCSIVHCGRIWHRGGANLARTARVFLFAEIGESQWRPDREAKRSVRRAGTKNERKPPMDRTSIEPTHRP
jgi:hypothetical protein